MSNRGCKAALLTVCIAVVLISIGAAADNKPKSSKGVQEISVSGNQALDIPESERHLLEPQALAGSGVAAHRLANHYLFVASDKEKGMYWETISAENGDPTGMYSLGLYLYQQHPGDQEALVRARYWLDRARQAGQPLAQGVLEEIDKTSAK